MTEAPQTLIIGAGPAGLTAAYELAKDGHASIVVESDPTYVGGIARTARYGPYRFDIGGHRFFSKNSEIVALWREILPDEFIEVPRLSRIFYRGRFYDYPLRPANAVRNLGVWQSSMCVASYVYRKARPIAPERSFQDWVTNRFGGRLFDTFFRSYTEKVWGMPCSEISADWAAQRIKGLSLSKAVLGAIGLNSRRGVVKTLIDRFHYPRLGPGRMWERCTELVKERGSEVVMDRTVVRLERDDGGIRDIVCRDQAGAEHRYPCRHVISSMPLRNLVLAMDPTPPAPVVAAARSLRYRDFLTVALVVRQEHCFPDNWIYIHDPAVKVGRIQNFGRWSKAMVPEPGVTVLGLEYFCFEGDDLWATSDDDLLELGATELDRIGLVAKDRIEDGTVVRMPKAYPIYDEGYKTAVGTIRAWLQQHVPNVAPAGRNGMHKYNNQDHSMMAALLAARNLTGRDMRDPWKVNTDAEYHEEEEQRSTPAGRAVPARVQPEEDLGPSR
ncbi:MAG: NAD(P)/FAD-dependent oxidoreductase [Planctomycetota bacterium]|jgi:protoporphyrinogen oxidase